MEHVDVVVVGAGLSGIGAAVRLQTLCPDKRYVILEGRERSGGTWDLFRYPGVRSDSDMYTLGYPFRPWTGAAAIADGPSILSYLRDTAAEHGVEHRIRYQHRVTAAAWSSDDERWTLELAVGPEGRTETITASFLHLCTGYYRYDGGHRPEFPGEADFAGRIVHPQDWPEDLDYRDRQVVIIGSGATAVTLAPAMAATAAQVTVLQRSPTYVMSAPAVDPLARVVSRLPARWAQRALRWKNLAVSSAFFQLAQRRPGLVRGLLRRAAIRQLPDGYDVDTDFSPRYDPWDERLCLAPDGDFYRAIADGAVTVVTDHIERFTPEGIRLASGRQLAADVVVSATGLRLLACGGITLRVDGEVVDVGRSFVYRGFMLSGLPNLAMCVGYTNASWTLRADLVSRAVCRLLNTMDARGATVAVPRLDGRAGQPHPLLDLKAGYVRRSADALPKSGSRAPWKLRQNYLLDVLSARFGDDTECLELSGPGRRATGADRAAATPATPAVAGAGATRTPGAD